MPSPLSRALGAGANLVPLALLVVGVGTLVHAIAPRAATPGTPGLVIGGYLIEFVGSITRAPRWLRDISPFHHIAPYPAADIRPVALLVLAASAQPRCCLPSSPSTIETSPHGR
jgi:ABC-2 type transport system permease protein